MDRPVSELKPHPLNATLYGDTADADLLESVRRLRANQQATASAAAYEQLRQITAISLAANMVFLAALIWALTT